jgi:hypothetical protein
MVAIAIEHRELKSGEAHRTSLEYLIKLHDIGVFIGQSVRCAISSIMAFRSTLSTVHMFTNAQNNILQNLDSIPVHEIRNSVETIYARLGLVGDDCDSSVWVWR